ncbi:septal ring lytic transglycosylase RlpA family protein [Magnetovibrio sp.]|uniref:septal ring lytic transglycosylase RlpA family protein n=1 Tax=Magnetovibrio sp. TaxID=2024836 RepID=UPI002F950FF4
MRLIYKLSLVAVSAGLLAACAETKFVMHTAKRLGETNKSQGDYKVGKPYQVGGIWYYPSEDMSYDRTGIASWYGPNFDGKRTANGEIFDQWEVSAAHKTLPMPSVVRVTNLVNGRSLVVRINDRGPFKPGRIIDLSRRAAQLLDIEKSGTAQVRVQILPQESRILAQRAKAGGTQLLAADTPIKAEGVSSQPVASQTLPEPPQMKMNSKLYVPPRQSVESAPIEMAKVEQAPLVDAPVTEAQRPVKVGEVAQVAVSPTRLFIQAGAFSNASNAERVKQHLATIGDARVTPVSVNGRDFYRVRIGPLTTVAEADALLPQIIDAGYSGARTVVDSTATN